MRPVRAATASIQALPCGILSFGAGPGRVQRAQVEAYDAPSRSAGLAQTQTMTTLTATASDDLPDAIAELVRQLDDAIRERRNAELRCARLLEQLSALRAWEAESCASVQEFGERHGLAAEDARALLQLGRGMKAVPELVPQLLEGRITVPAAAAISEVLASPDLVRLDDDWIGWAQRENSTQLRRRIRRRREESRAGEEPVRDVHLVLRQRSVDDLERARELASRRVDRALSWSETVEVTTEFYLASLDPDRVKPGARRSPPTNVVDGRYVPAAVRRTVFERQGRRCAVPYCGHTLFLELAHIIAHARGGSREADNLLLLCSAHHELFDLGGMTLEGTAIQPRFFDWRGRPMGERRSATTPGAPLQSNSRTAAPRTANRSRAAPAGSGGAEVRRSDAAHPKTSRETMGGDPAASSETSRHDPPGVESGPPQPPNRPPPPSSRQPGRRPRPTNGPEEPRPRPT